MKKTIKLNGNQLRRLISEAISTREPGSPLFSPPKQKLSEKFGAWDREVRMTGGGPEGEDDLMMPHNFENMAREQFSALLDTVAEAFVDSHMEMVEAGFSPESHAGYREMLMDKALAMKQELMTVVEKHSDSVLDEL